MYKFIALVCVGFLGQLLAASQDALSVYPNTPSPLNVTTLTSQASPKIIVDGRGNSVAVWQDDNSGIVYSAFLQAGSTVWTNQTALWTSVGGYNVHQTAIAISPRGLGVIVWSVIAGSNYGPLYAVTFRVLDTVSYSPLMQVSTSGQQASSCVVTIGTNGNALAVWENKADSPQTLYSAFLPSGSSSWIFQQQISNASTSLTAEEPTVAINAHDQGIVGWRLKNNASVGQIFSRNFAFIAGGVNFQDIKNLFKIFLRLKPRKQELPCVG